MNKQSEVGGIGWALRHYAAAVLTILVVAAALATLMAGLSRQDAEYEATSLVVANDVRLKPEQVPRFAQSVFDSGAVAQKVTVREGLSRDYRTLRPASIWMDPVPDSITFLVHGRSADALQAARLSNAASVAFVEELNKVGQDVGTFSVQDTADAPLARTPSGLGTSLALMVALAGGGVISLAVVWMLYSILRPVVGGSEAAQISGVPLLAQVTLPRWRSSSRGTAPGLRRLAGHLLLSGADVVVLAGTDKSRPARQWLVDELAVLPGTDALRSLVLLPDADDVPLPAAAGGIAVVLVVPVGTPARHFEQVCQDFLEEEVLGVVLVQRGTQRKPRVTASAGRASQPGSATEVEVEVEVGVGVGGRPTAEPADVTSRLLSSTWMRPPARSHGVEDPVLAIAHQVARSAAADQWFPDLRRTPQTQISLLAERRRCALYRIRLLGPDVQHEVLLKLRRPGGLRTGATQTPSRPALAPCLALTEQERAAFEFQGLERAVAAVVAADPPAELGAVRPLLLLQEQAALVMDYIPHRTLRDRLHAAHRVGRVGAAPPLTLVGAAAGKWLRHLHATGSEQPHGTRLTSGLEVAALLPQFADHLARLLGERSLLARVRTAGEVLAHALPERLPSAVLHGDFAPRNVLVSPTGGVLVVDPMPTWRAAVHEDVARLLVGARLTRLQLVTGGLAIAPEELDGHEKAFLRAYYGDEDERLEVGAFCLLVALDQWAALLAQLSPTTGRLRGVAGVEARWVGRTVEAEVQRRLDAVERLVQSPLVGRAAGAAPTT